MVSLFKKMQPSNNSKYLSFINKFLLETIFNLFI